MTSLERIAWCVAAGTALLAVGSAHSDEWLPARPDRPWRFPQDHWAHKETALEWWYLTGILTERDAPAGTPPRRFGFQFTFFRIGLAPDAIEGASKWHAGHAIMGHAAVTELGESGRHHFSDVLHRAAAPLLGGFGSHPEPPIAWCRAPAGTDGTWQLAWNGEGFDVAMTDDVVGIAFDLATRPARPLVLHGENGFSRKNAAGTAASNYYSFTRLDTTGTITVAGKTFRVTGTSWMDHEFGSSKLGEGQVGWDWFALRLADGRDLMLYVLRTPDGRADYALGTLVDADGGARRLDSSDFTVTARASWTSDSSRATYPSRWTVAVPGASIALDVQPLLAAQENVSRQLDDLQYWEGAVEAYRSNESDGGAVVAEGYVELTGYGSPLRLPF